MQNMFGRSCSLNIVISAVLAAICGAGCSSDVATPKGEQAQISGSVVIDGTPIPVDSIVLFKNDDEGLTLASTVDSLGKFAMKPADPRVGVPVGRYRVAIQPPSPAAVTANQGSQDYTAMMKGTSASAAPPKAVESPIPEKFRDAGSSEIVFEVNAGPNQFDLDLAKL